MSETRLQKILRRFDRKLNYINLDRDALDMSRAVSAGNLGCEKFVENYANWAMVSDDPLVVVNIVKTYITTLNSKLTAHPFRPLDDQLNEKGEGIRLNSQFGETYNDVLNDGYAYLGIGNEADGTPIVKPIDARYIMFNGDDPTLKDATEVVVFQVVPKTADEIEEDKYKFVAFPDGYVEFDPEEERVITTYYHIEKGVVYMEVFNSYDDTPKPQKLANLDRIPVVRFVGDKVELTEDKRFHYRGIYYFVGSVLKAMTLAATKLQIRTATSDDDNYMMEDQALADNEELWRNAGVKTYAAKDANGMEIGRPIPIPHDNQFLVNVFDTWLKVIGDMLGPVIASGSEAVTREEVIARNEVKDAITNEYLSKFVDSVEEVYRCIVMLNGGPKSKVKICGGFLENVKRQKADAELMGLYNLAKESGLNTQGFVYMKLANSDLPTSVKMKLEETFKQDPYASPLVVQLKQQIGQLSTQLQAKDQTIALLRLQATQRLERQAEYVKSNETIEMYKLRLKQWEDEQKQTQDARMEVLKTLLANGDVAGAMACVAAIQQQTPPVVPPPDAMETDAKYQQIVANQVNESINVPMEVMGQTGPVMGPNGPVTPTGANPQFNGQTRLPPMNTVVNKNTIRKQIEDNPALSHNPSVR